MVAGSHALPGRRRPNQVVRPGLLLLDCHPAPVVAQAFEASPKPASSALRRLGSEPRFPLGWSSHDACRRRTVLSHGGTRRPGTHLSANVRRAVSLVACAGSPAAPAGNDVALVAHGPVDAA